MGPGKIMKNPGKRLLQRPNPPMCDNSNDSGLGYENQDPYHMLNGSSAAAAAMASQGQRLNNNNNTNNHHHTR